MIEENNEIVENEEAKETSQFEADLGEECVSQSSQEDSSSEVESVTSDEEMDSSDDMAEADESALGIPLEVQGAEVEAVVASCDDVVDETQDNGSAEEPADCENSADYFPQQNEAKDADEVVEVAEAEAIVETEALEITEVVEEDKPWSHGLDEEFEENDYPRPVIESVIESILFASDEPVSAAKLMGIAEISSTKQVNEAVDKLNEKYEQTNSAFKINQIAGGYQMMTHRVYNHWLLKLIRVRTESKLSQAALETLAIIAYKQPIIRADIEAIRGVSSGEMIRGLMQKGLVKIAGRAEVIGRPMLYGTTKKFLELFGLNSLKDLPKAADLKKPE